MTAVSGAENFLCIYHETMFRAKECRRRVRPLFFDTMLQGTKGDGQPGWNAVSFVKLKYCVTKLRNFVTWAGHVCFCVMRHERGPPPAPSPRATTIPLRAGSGNRPAVRSNARGRRVGHDDGAVPIVRHSILAGRVQSANLADQAEPWVAERDDARIDK